KGFQIIAGAGFIVVENESPGSPLPALEVALAGIAWRLCLVARPALEATAPRAVATGFTYGSQNPRSARLSACTLGYPRAAAAEGRFPNCPRSAERVAR